MPWILKLMALLSHQAANTSKSNFSKIRFSQYCKNFMKKTCMSSVGKISRKKRPKTQTMIKAMISKNCLLTAFAHSFPTSFNWNAPNEMYSSVYMVCHFWHQNFQKYSWLQEVSVLSILWVGSILYRGDDL